MCRSHGNTCPEEPAATLESLPKAAMDGPSEIPVVSSLQLHQRGVARLVHPIVGTPPIRVVSRHATRLQQRLQLEKHAILLAPKDVGEQVPTVMIDRMPQSPRVRLAALITPHFFQPGG